MNTDTTGYGNNEDRDEKERFRQRVLSTQSSCRVQLC